MLYSTMKLVEFAVKTAVEAGLVKQGDLVVAHCRRAGGCDRLTNTICIHQVGGSLVNAMGIVDSEGQRPSVRVPQPGVRGGEVSPGDVW